MKLTIQEWQDMSWRLSNIIGDIKATGAFDSPRMIWKDVEILKGYAKKGLEAAEKEEHDLHH